MPIRATVRSEIRRILREICVAYRFAAVTLAITMLIPRDRPAWVVAEHRLIEVSAGIAVALFLTVAWRRD